MRDPERCQYEQCSAPAVYRVSWKGRAMGGDHMRVHCAACLPLVLATAAQLGIALTVTEEQGDA